MKLKMFRRVARLSMSDLSRLSGVDISIISKLEKDPTAGASYENTVRLAAALGVDVLELAPVDLSTVPRAVVDAEEQPPETE